MYQRNVYSHAATNMLFTSKSIVFQIQNSRYSLAQEPWLKHVQKLKTPGLYKFIGWQKSTKYKKETASTNVQKVGHRDA